MTAEDEDEGHTHQIAVYIKVCEEPTQHVADVEVFGTPQQASATLANALRSLANVIDHRGTFEELVQGL